MPTRFTAIVAAALCAALPARADKGTRFTSAPPRPPAAPRPAAAPRPPPPPPDWDDDEDDDDDDEVRDRSRVIASRDDDDDDDEDEDDRGDRREDREDRGARVYRMDRDKDRDKERIKERVKERMGRHRDEDGDEDEDGQGPAKAKGRGAVRMPVSGAVTLQLRASAGDIEIVASDRREVALSLSESPADEIALYQAGDRVEASFRGRRELRRGKLRVEVPKGTRVDLASMSGDLSVSRVAADVRIRSMSGDVKLVSVGKADVQTVSGDVRIEDAAGPVRLHTVSGNGVVTTGAASPQLEFESASGGLDWSGACGRDCHVAAETVSGDVKLSVDPKSSFELSYTSHSGELHDELSLAVKHAPKRKHGGTGGWLAATYGKGEGVIECDAFSGSLLVRKR